MARSIATSATTLRMGAKFTPDSIIPIASLSIDRKRRGRRRHDRKRVTPDGAAGRLIRSVIAQGLQDKLGRPGHVEEHPFSRCLDVMSKVDVISPMDGAQHAALGLFRKPIEQGRIGAIDPGELAVARGAGAALNGRHSSAPFYQNSP